MELADELIAKSSDENLKQALEKNEERRALEGMREEIRDEALARERGET